MRPETPLIIKPCIVALRANNDNQQKVGSGLLYFGTSPTTFQAQKTQRGIRPSGPLYARVWWNWHTHRTLNPTLPERAFAGSSPATRTIFLFNDFFFFYFRFLRDREQGLHYIVELSIIAFWFWGPSGFWLLALFLIHRGMFKPYT